MKFALIGLLLIIPGLLFAPDFIYKHFEEPVVEVKEPVRLFFVGDIMLARDVENYLDREGPLYPFARISGLLSSYDVAVGNFEAVVSEPHVKAPSFTFQFSVRPEYLKGLKEAGFDILSLANNHSSDYGDAAVALTKKLCIEYWLHCAGTARNAESFVYEVRDMNIGFLFVNTTWNTESPDSLAEDMRAIVQRSDIQIAYIHWGTEYELVHNAEQETLAHALIDAGADAIIGHHPHVVQDVGFYKENPIFYSLGNFIFDQYWNEDVQTGLGVEMVIEDKDIRYRTIPFTRKDARNQPAFMSTSSSELLHARIFREQEHTGEFTTQRAF